MLPLGINRVVLLCWLASGLLCLFFFLAFRRPTVVPRGLQNYGEMAIGAVRTQVIDEVLGDKAKRWVPYLVSLFFFLFIGNLFEIIPLINFPITSKISIPLALAVMTWLLFNYLGVREHGAWQYLKMNVAPSGVPKPILLIIGPIELVSTFIVRPLTLTIRLTANMVAGHLILGFFFAGSTYLLSGLWGGEGANPITAVWSLGTIAGGIIFVAFEFLVGLLQAYIFTLLTAVYIAGALEHEH